MQEPYATIKDAVLLAIALWGAVLSTVNWRNAANRDRRSLRVVMSTGMLGYDNGRLGAPMAEIRVTNTGHRQVTVRSISLEMPGGGRMVSMGASRTPGMVDTQLPSALADGQSAHLWMSYAEIGRALRDSGRATATIYPVAEDSAGQTHRGEPWTVNAQELIDMGEAD